VPINIAIYLDGQWLGIIESNREVAEPYWEERSKRFSERSYRLVDVPVGTVPERRLKDQLKRAA
jgi:hypothetical protein